MRSPVGIQRVRLTPSLRSTGDPDHDRTPASPGRAMTLRSHRPPSPRRATSMARSSRTSVWTTAGLSASRRRPCRGRSSPRRSGRRDRRAESHRRYPRPRGCSERRCARSRLRRWKGRRRGRCRNTRGPSGTCLRGRPPSSPRRGAGVRPDWPPSGDPSTVTPCTLVASSRFARTSVSAAPRMHTPTRAAWMRFPTIAFAAAGRSTKMPISVASLTSFRVTRLLSDRPESRMPIGWPLTRLPDTRLSPEPSIEMPTRRLFRTMLPTTRLRFDGPSPSLPLSSTMSCQRLCSAYAWSRWARAHCPEAPCRPQPLRARPAQ